MLVGLLFLLGIAAAPFLPETRGKPLPALVQTRSRCRSALATDALLAYVVHGTT